MSDQWFVGPNLFSAVIFGENMCVMDLNVVKCMNESTTLLLGDAIIYQIRFNKC